MMGDPTSFPVMPLMSAYAAKCAKHDRFDGMLTGDDAAFSGFARHKVAPYESAMARLGGVISVNKTEWHPKKALFCEVPYYEGRRQQFTFLSNWVAPPGGSKGEVNWVNQSLTVVQQNHVQGKPASAGLWEFSPLWRMQQAAYLLGIPIGADPEHGGSSHPKFPRTSVRWHAKWIGYLSTLNASELIAGAGLSIFPSPYQDLRLKAAKFVEKGINDRKEEALKASTILAELSEGRSPEVPVPVYRYDTNQAYGASGILNRTIEEVCDEAAAPLISASLYFRGPIEIKHAPSIQRAARRFFYKVKKAPPMQFGYTQTKAELMSRTSVYVTRRWRLPEHNRIVYGLGESDPVMRVRLRHWAVGRVAFR